MGRELTADEIRDFFFREFANLSVPLALLDYELDHHAEEKGTVLCTARIALDGAERSIQGAGNGPINAFVHALDKAGLKNFKVTDYRSHAVRGGSDADSAAYVQIQHLEEEAQVMWGSGLDPSIEMAGLRALVSAYNLLNAAEPESPG